MPDACGFHMLLQLCAKTFAKLSHRALAKSKHDLHLVPGSDFALEVVGSDLSEGRRRIDAAGNDSMGFTNPPSLAGLRRILVARSEEHTSELQSLMRTSYAFFCLKKKTHKIQNTHIHTT